MREKISRIREFGQLPTTMCSTLLHYLHLILQWNICAAKRNADGFTGLQCGHRGGLLKMQSTATDHNLGHGILITHWKYSSVRTCHHFNQPWTVNSQTSSTHGKKRNHKSCTSWFAVKTMNNFWQALMEKQSTRIYSGLWQQPSIGTQNELPQSCIQLQHFRIEEDQKLLNVFSINCVWKDIQRNTWHHQPQFLRNGKKPKWWAKPYNSPLSKATARILSPNSVKASHKSTSTLRDQLMKLKTPWRNSKNLLN